MAQSTAYLFRKVTDRLVELGFLLESDADLPSVVALVAGEPVRGSWFGHPKGHDIFAACRHLYAHPDAVCLKLISGKTTFVHRELWASLLAVVTEGEAWQLEGLSAEGRSLLRRIETQGRVTTEELRGQPENDGVDPSDPLAELERRLLVHTRLVHTDTGHHSKILSTWAHWAAGARKGGGLGGRQGAKRAKGILELMLEVQNERFDGRGTLPWQ